MKKLLLSLAAVVLGFTAATAQTTWDFVANTYGMTRLSGTTSEYNSDPLTITNGTSKIEATGNTRLWADGFRVYKQSQFTISMSGATISKIELYGPKGTSLLTATAPIALSDNQPGSYAAGTWTGAATSVSFKYTATKSNQAIGKIVITTEGGPVEVKEDAEMSFPEATYTVKLGDAFNAPKVNKATDAEAVYSSDKEAVAKVDATTGNVTIVGAGKAIITATCAETKDFYAGTAKYTLIVEDANTFWAPNCKDKTNPEFTFVTVNGDFNPWSVDDRFGLKGSAFKNSKANASDAVAASPVLDFTEYKAPMTLDYRQALNQFKVNDELIDCTDEAIAPYVSVVAKEEGAAEWTKIGDVNAPEKFGWNFYDGTQVDLSAFAGKKVQIGFRYVSTTECAGTWEIDNVVVKATKNADAVESIVAEDTNAPVEYYNLQGVRVANPAAGNLYIVRQGNKVSKQIIK